MGGSKELPGEGLSVLDMEVWDWVLFGGAAFVAVISLVILMLRRRDEVVLEADPPRNLQRQELPRDAHDENQRQKSKRAA